jgi:hypothetical protein
MIGGCAASCGKKIPLAYFAKGYVLYSPRIHYALSLPASLSQLKGLIDYDKYTVLTSSCQGIFTTA